MRTLDRYLTVLFARNLALTLAVLIGLYGVIDFIEKVDDFIEHGAALVHYLRYPLVKLPLMFSQTLPMAALLATFATVGGLARTSQLTALQSCGIGVWRVTRPLFAAGIGLCLLVVAGQGWLIPWSNRQVGQIMDADIRGAGLSAHRTEDLYFHDGRRIVSVSRSYPEQAAVAGLGLLEFNDRFALVRRLEAKTARHLADGRWLLFDVSDRSFDPDSRDLTRFNRTRELAFDLGRRPEEMIELWYDPQEVTLSELWGLAARLEAEGRDPRRYLAEWHHRLAQCATPLIMVLLGVPFALQRGRKASLGLGVAASIAVFVGYYVLQAVAVASGTADLLPLPLAAWTANLLLLLIGAWLFLTLQEN